MLTFKISIVSPERILFEGEGVYLYVPGAAGSMGILPNHAPLLSSLTPGSFELRLSSPAQTLTFTTTRSGFIEVLNNNISILLDAADSRVIVLPQNP